jgi:amidase
VQGLCRRAADRFAQLGAVVEEASPDLGTAVEVFRVLRAAQFAGNMAPLLEQHRDRLKPEVVWNVEQGMRLGADEIGRAERERGALQRRMAEFLGRYDLLLCPAAVVPPFRVEVRYLEELNGHRFPSYIDWVAINYAVTLTGCPALSLPCGFTASGLPVGLQMVGPPRGEAKLLAAAAMLEDALGIAASVPIDPRAAAA